MGKQFVYFGVLTILVGIVSVSPAFSQGYEVTECVSYATGRHAVGSTWTETKGGTRYSCRCDSRQGIVCTPISSGGTTGGFTPPSGRLSPSQQMAAGIMGAFFSGLFSNMFDDISAPPDTSYQDALKRQQEEGLLKQQEIKKQAIERWLNLQAEEQTRKLNEEAEKKKRGEAILAQSGIGSGGLKRETIGGGKLTPFSWDTPAALEPAPAGKYNTSKFTEMERLLCAAYFSKMAGNASKSGDMESVRFYGLQMDNVFQGVPTAVECKPPKDLSMTADIRKAGELNQKYAKMAILYKKIMPKIDKLQEIESKLDEGKKKREEAEQKIMKLDKQIDEIKSRSQTSDTSENKVQEDDLLALKSKAAKQLLEANELEKTLSVEKQRTEDELNAIKDKMVKGEER